MEKKVYLIRHSEQLKIKNEEEKNEQIKNEKIILSVEGEKKAEKLSKNSQLKNIEELWSSNYVRAISTAKYIANENKIEINISSKLGERKLGDLKTLKEMAKQKKNSYTTEQLLDKQLKNKDGENCEEVSKRMEEKIQEIVENTTAKKIAIVSHGAAIKFYLSNYCQIDENINFIYNGKILIKENLESPDIIELSFIKNKLNNINHISM